MKNDLLPDGPAEGQAAGAVFERFTRRLIGLARGRLDVRLRHKIDPEDVVQSAYKSFFLRYGHEALAAEGWDGLWGLLTVITLRKCADRVRYHRAERGTWRAKRSDPRTTGDARPARRQASLRRLFAPWLSRDIARR